MMIVSLLISNQVINDELDILLLGVFAFQRSITQETDLKSKETNLYRWYFTSYMVIWLGSRDGFC